MELQDYFNVVRRYFKVILATTLIGGVAAAALTFLMPHQPPGYTSTVQGVLLTNQAAVDLQDLIEQASNYSATTVVLVQIPSPDSARTDEEYTKSRIAFYSKILGTEATLSKIANQAGVSVDDLRKHIVIATPENSTLLSIRVSNADSEIATQLSESVADELARRITSVEAPRAEVEKLGTEINAPINLQVTTAVRELIAADPQSVAAAPENALSLFGETELQKLSQDLDLTLTPEQLSGALTLSAGLPSTTTQVETATAEQIGTITVTATDPDPGTADRIASDSFELLQNKIFTESRLSESANSPLVITGGTSATDNLVPGANPGPNSRLSVNVILGLLIGAAVGFGYAFLRSSQDTTIRSARQLVDLTGELPIGIISKMDELGSNPWMVMLSDPSPTAENYRALRANLMFGMQDVKVLCLTSAGGGSTRPIAVNLAVALSQAGQSVILVEGNLREPVLSQGLNLGGPNGLDTVLTGTSTSRNAIELWAPGGISVLSTKLAAPNSSEMLSTEAFTVLIDELRGLFSYVIVSTPSALNSTDAAIVSSRCDATLVLTECGKSTTVQLEIAVTSLLQVGAPIAGVVISGVPASEVNSWRAAHVSNPQSAS